MHKKTTFTILLCTLLLLNPAVIANAQNLLDDVNQIIDPDTKDNVIDTASEDTIDNNQTDNNVDTAETDSDTKQMQKSEDSEVPLSEQMLPIDIQTSGYYELLAWCKKLGLETTGNKEALQERIINHFGLSKEEVLKKEEETKIRIMKAAQVDYFKLDMMEEKYVVLTGGVNLRMTEEKKSSTHIIKSDRVVFNQTKETITALGKVDYTLEEEGNKRKFNGDSMTFFLNNWEGAFYTGSTTQEKELDGKKLTFKFSGSSINKSAQDIIILNNGTITSSQRENPNYRIEAEKVWMFAPGEWGIRNALLYVGRIPVLYIPFFYMPGDQFFFHPAVGHEERRGNFINTTTYILGQKEKKEAPFSFMQLTQSESDKKMVKERKGLFLQETEKELEREEKWTLKLLFDIYSSLGVFVGIEGEDKEGKIFNNTSIYAGIARSRTIYKNNLTGTYTPYEVTLDNTPQSNWNNSTLFGFTLPIRYGVDATGNINYKKLRTKISMEYYSDPYFRKDFGGRKEDIQWKKIMGLEDEEDEEEKSLQSVKNSVNMTIENNIRTSFPILEPYINSINIGDFDMGIRFLSKENLKKSDASDEDPMKKFYYPNMLFGPDLTASFSGTLFSFPFETDNSKQSEKNKEKKEEPPTAKPKEPVAPWNHEKNNKKEEKEEEITEFELPNISSDIPVRQKETKPFDMSFSYNFQPKITQESETLNSNWNTPEDIDLTIKSGIVEFTNTSNLKYNTSILDKLVALNSSIYLKTNNLNYYYLNDQLTEKEIENEKNKEKTNYSLLSEGSANMEINPFRKVSLLEPISLSYDFNAQLYREKYIYDNVNSVYVIEKTPFEWDVELVKTHKYAISYTPNIFSKKQNLSFTSTLPPLDDSKNISSSTHLAYDPFYIILNGSMTKEAVENEDITGEPEWEIDPIKTDFGVKTKEYGSLTQKATYDWEESRFTSADTSLSSFGFSAEYNMNYTKNYNFDKEKGWIREEEESFLPWNISFAYKKNLDTQYFWKNRIQLLNTSLNTSWNNNIQKVSDSRLSFTFNSDLSIFNFLTLKFDYSAENTMMYRYIPPFSRKVDKEPLNLFTDLAKSFNFFDKKNRLASNFNIKSIKISGEHYLEDWRFTYTYSGGPELSENEAGIKEYKWSGAFTFLLQWDPIPEIKTEIDGDDESIDLWG